MNSATVARGATDAAESRASTEAAVLELLSVNTLVVPAKAVDTVNVNIDYAADDSCQIQLWARGTHPGDKFLAACELELMVWAGRREKLAGKAVLHEHRRTVRADAETRNHGVCETVHVKSLPGRGAYAVTVLEDWLPLHTSADR